MSLSRERLHPMQQCPRGPHVSAIALELGAGIGGHVQQPPALRLGARKAGGTAQTKSPRRSEGLIWCSGRSRHLSSPHPHYFSPGADAMKIEGETRNYIGLIREKYEQLDRHIREVMGWTP